MVIRTHIQACWSSKISRVLARAIADIRQQAGLTPNLPTIIIPRDPAHCNPNFRSSLNYQSRASRQGGVTGFNAYFRTEPLEVVHGRIDVFPFFLTRTVGTGEREAIIRCLSGGNRVAGADLFLACREFGRVS